VKSGKFWLRDKDMLPGALNGRCRILTYSYPASVASVLGKTSSDRILQHATTLVAELVADREVSVEVATIVTSSKLMEPHNYNRSKVLWSVRSFLFAILWEV
jgi:hypothetical protein